MCKNSTIKMFDMRLLFIMMMLALLQGSPIAAQSANLMIYPNEMITYTQVIDGQKQYVIRYTDRAIYFTLPEGKCAFLSEDWRYYFVFDKSGNMIRIFHTISNQLIAENS